MSLRRSLPRTVPRDVWFIRSITGHRAYCLSREPRMTSYRMLKTKTATAPARERCRSAAGFSRVLAATSTPTNAASRVLRGVHLRVLGLGAL